MGERHRARTREDEAGFWEVNGYHMRGDPWTEERYRDDLDAAARGSDPGRGVDSQSGQP